MGRKRRLRAVECPHTAPIAIREEEYPWDEGVGFIAQCLICGTESPVHETAQEALKALQDMGWGNQ